MVALFQMDFGTDYVRIWWLWWCVPGPFCGPCCFWPARCCGAFSKRA